MGRALRPIPTHGHQIVVKAPIIGDDTGRYGCAVIVRLRLPNLVLLLYNHTLKTFQ